MITKLTDEQKAKIPEYFEKWKKIGEEYRPLDREKCVSLIKEFCGYAELYPTEFKFFESPKACQKAINEQFNPGEPEKYYELSWYQLGNINVSYCNFYDFLIEEVKKPSDEVMPIWNCFKQVCEESHMFWVIEDTVFFSEKPKELHFKENRLHHVEGPAVLYADGWAMYVIEGQRFDKEELDNMTAQKILDETNAERRMAMVSYYGVDKMMSELQCETIEEISGTELYKKYPIKKYYQHGDVLMYNESAAKPMVYADLSDEMKERLKRVKYKLVKLPKHNYHCLIMNNPSIDHTHNEFVPESATTVFDAIMYRHQEVNPEALPGVLS